MAKDFAKQFYRSKAWQRCRDSYISQRRLIDGGICELCGRDLGYILHHKIKLTAENINEPEITLNHNNLMYVCHACHDAIHYEDMQGRQRSNCVFNERGEPIDIRGL